jgi:hypothetical protein
VGNDAMSGRRAGFLLGALLVVWTAGFPVVATHAASQRPHTKEYAITVDATALHPPTWWYVPGVTPLIWSLEPENTDAFKTTERQELKLKPGAYRFGTFTFDFPFMVTMDGKLDFAPSLDQCVGGRGTAELKVLCSKVQPYAGQPEYWKNGK